MTRKRAILLALAAAALAGLASCSNDRGGVRGAGTIEMDEIDVASLVGGRVLSIPVAEGDTIRAGDTLAVLSRGEVSAEVAQQVAQAQRAQTQARDMAEGARPAEVLVARAALAAVQADLRLAQITFERSEKLAASQAVAQAELDRARAARDAALAREKSAAEQLRLQEQGFRSMQVTAARQGAVAAIAQLAGARSLAGELVLTAPQAGVVLLRNFDPGELAAPAMAVVTLGDPERLWMRVYVGAPSLTAVRIGAAVDVTPIGSKRSFPGHVIQINTRAEFTPRAALTEEEQANLVFGVKVALDPGLPAEARIHTSP